MTYFGSYANKFHVSEKKLYWFTSFLRSADILARHFQTLYTIKLITFFDTISTQYADIDAAKHSIKCLAWWNAGIALQICLPPASMMQNTAGQKSASMVSTKSHIRRGLNLAIRGA